jgi:DNA-binding transcriptional regulator YiaG
MVNIRDNLTLKACRIITGTKAEEIAEACNVNINTVYKWEKSESFPTAPQLKMIVKCFEGKGYTVDINDINFFCS